MRNARREAATAARHLAAFLAIPPGASGPVTAGTRLAYADEAAASPREGTVTRLLIDGTDAACEVAWDGADGAVATVPLAALGGTPWRVVAAAGAPRLADAPPVAVAR